jgi:hypothetical protein
MAEFENFWPLQLFNDIMSARRAANLPLFARKAKNEGVHEKKKKIGLGLVLTYFRTRRKILAKITIRNTVEAQQ